MAKVPNYQPYFVFAWPRDKTREDVHFTLIAAKKADAVSRVRKYLGPAERGKWIVIAYTEKYLGNRPVYPNTIDLDDLEYLEADT